MYIATASLSHGSGCCEMHSKFPRRASQAWNVPNPNLTTPEQSYSSFSEMGGVQESRNQRTRLAGSFNLDGKPAALQSWHLLIRPGLIATVSSRPRTCLGLAPSRPRPARDLALVSGSAVSGWSLSKLEVLPFYTGTFGIWRMYLEY